MILGNSVSSNDIVLNLGRSTGTDRVFAGVLSGEESDELLFWGFFQVDFTETEDSIRMKGKDEIPSSVGLFGREDIQGMRRHCPRKEDDMLKDRIWITRR